MKETIEIINREIDKQENNNAGYVGDMIVKEIIINGGNLWAAENALRETSSRVYLLALPIGWFGGEFKSFFPGYEKDFPFALWVCMNGKMEALRELMQHGFTPEENIVRLTDCGFLTPKEK